MTMRIGVCGAGAWGTALALAAATDGAPVTLWARDAGPILEVGESPRLPGYALPPSIGVTADLAALGRCGAILLAVPARHLKALAADLVNALERTPPLVSCAKGLSQDTAQLMHDMLRDVAPDSPLGALSGPSFAADVAAGRPTAVTLGCDDGALARRLAMRLSQRHFRVYPTDDLVGVEVGGAVKNVLAIACGVAAGLSLGDSAEAALIARGFAEMTRLGVALGARPETLSGLSGLGDLVLTAKGDASRNRRFGRALGEGVPIEEALGAIGTVEGVASAPNLARLAAAHGVSMPISEMVARVVSGEVGVGAAIERLLARPVGEENVAAPSARTG